MCIMTTFSAKVSNGRIALIEDDPNIRTSTKIYLSSQGFSIETFNSAEGFLSIFQQTPPFDLILLDLNLPGKSGFDLCEVIKKNPDSPSIIIITAQNDEQTAVRCFE